MVLVPAESVAKAGGPLHIRTDDGQSVIAIKFSVTDTSIVVTRIKTLEYAPRNIPPRTILFENIVFIAQQEGYLKKMSNTEMVLNGLLWGFGGSGF